ncbi:hypothetical protein KKC13_08765 [bacterium]|nr:hypothetical protein [bacterium]MBU1958625.1 hypothetical protein [bacterium]
MKKLTHGEAYFLRRESLDFSQSLDKIYSYLEKIPPKMTRHKALEYYGAKFKKYFGIEEVQLRDFDSLESYYGYYEAKRMLKAMKCQNQVR